MKLQQSTREYEMPHQLTYYECDEQGHPILSMVMSMLSVVADEQSNELGLNQKTVQATGGTWVIASFEGKLDLQSLKIGNTVILGTRALGYNRFFATREYWLRDQDGQKEYARIKSSLVFMNLTSRKIESIPPKLITPYQAPEVKRVLRGRRPKQIPEGAELSSKQYHVRYYDLDGNHHVNNARYFDWLLDPLGEKFLTTHRLKSFVIQYHQEVRADHDIDSEFFMPTPLTSLHRIKNNDVLCTTAEFEWEKTAD